MEKLIDISPPLTSDIAVWPGDTPLSRHQTLFLEKGDAIGLSSVTTTVHVGAHADAPSHYCRTGLTIDEVDLAPYVGHCQVIEAYGEGLISLDVATIRSERVLFKTKTYHNHREFDPAFRAFDPSFVNALGERGCRLIGIDTPSVDTYDSKDLLSHHQLLKHGIRNLEGLDLSLANPGFYELIALPLRLVGFDASPVRAVLRRLPTD